MPAATLFTEIFPVRADALSALHAYLPVYKGDAPRTGGKLAYRLRGALGGHWLWLDGRLVTDVAPNPVKTMMALDALKAAHGKTFGKLELLEQDLRWQATAEHIAEFVIRGPLDELQETIKTALAKITLPMTHARIEREHKARAWAVGGLPAISLSVVSRLIYARSIMDYAAMLAKPAELVGLTVADTTSTLQGDIIKVVGTVDEHRQRLIDLSQRAVMRKLIEAAPADSLVLRVESKGEQYDYVADSLALVVTFETQRRFDVPPAQVERALQINPSLRAQLVKIAADIAKNSGLLDAAYSQQNAPDRFTVVLPKPSIVWGGDKARDFDREAMGAYFTKHSAWRFEGDTIRILTINALDEDADLFVESLSRELSKTHGIPLEIVRERRVKVISEENLDSAVRALAKEDAHALVAFFPDDPQGQDAASLHDDYLKRMTVARGLPSLVLHAGTLHRTEAMPHLIMGLLARAGGAPFAFEEPLPYADRIVGLAIHRVSKKDGDHLTALARLYSNRGAALGWRAARAVLRDGAGLAESVLEQLLPAREIVTKRTILHIDGSLHPEDAAALAAWEDQHDAVFYPVELIERGNPRLYAFADKKIELPARGSAFMLSEREALLAAAGAPWNATPQPLLVRNLAQMKMAQVLDSVMTMALLHHGAVGLPKLPVTISHAAEWREGIERGLFPQQPVGKSLWWL